MAYTIKIEIFPGSWWVAASTTDKALADKWLMKYKQDGHNAKMETVVT